MARLTDNYYITVFFTGYFNAYKMQQVERTTSRMTPPTPSSNDEEENERSYF